MPKRSAALLMYKRDGGVLRLLLVHPGGPFWAKRDAGAWSIPKGEYLDGEDPLAAARREFAEELGSAPQSGGSEPWPLGEVRQSGGKVVTAWALEGSFDVTQVASNMFEMEWPPKSGRQQSFPEVDRAAWFAPDDARGKILAGQLPFIDRLLERLA